MSAPFDFEMFRKALLTNLSGEFKFPEIRTMNEANHHLNRVFVTIRQPIALDLSAGNRIMISPCPCCSLDWDDYDLDQKRNPIEVLDEKRPNIQNLTGEEFDILESATLDGNEIEDFNRRKLHRDPFDGKTKRSPHAKKSHRSRPKRGRARAKKEMIRD